MKLLCTTKVKLRELALLTDVRLITFTVAYEDFLKCDMLYFQAELPQLEDLLLVGKSDVICFVISQR